MKQTVRNMLNETLKDVRYNPRSYKLIFGVVLSPNLCKQGFTTKFINK